MQCVHLTVSGDVIGVGFRSWARRQAQDLGLVGWVRNTPEETVEIVAEGPKDKLKELVKACRTGPEVAMIEKIDVSWERATGEFLSFEVMI